MCFRGKSFSESNDEMYVLESERDVESLRLPGIKLSSDATGL